MIHIIVIEVAFTSFLIITHAPLGEAEAYEMQVDILDACHDLGLVNDTKFLNSYDLIYNVRLLSTLSSSHFVIVVHVYGGSHGSSWGDGA